MVRDLLLSIIKGAFVIYKTGLTAPLLSVASVAASEVGSQASTKIKAYGIDMESLRTSKFAVGISNTFESIKEVFVPREEKELIELKAIKPELKRD